jgi:hypothetical protein
MTISQKEAVFNAVCSVVGQDSFDEAVSLTKEQRSEVINIVAEGLQQGEVNFSEQAQAKHDTFEKVQKYTNGLLTNWLNKDLRLNGNIPHQIKNPGSRAGSGDSVLRELRKLRSTITDAQQQAAVDIEIDKRLAQIQAEKAKKVEIDMDLIPEELRALVNSSI